ncbi:hypothetical protein GSU68_09895 [Rathayibacter sp. VKM Ac-2759]|uniref:hypothetical protein n=1 Tax=Rathayibacter sp. VKM Ac-2759 TaxID=2609252 RepID=UPI001317E0E8|nr:hypothetical protein [Rathayibacter sp. VKM Ac-2759]QHC66840.1 hypothetical protein GSU68_09895 [Rathayibacter sp. VKM Ac-2759]
MEWFSTWWDGQAWGTVPDWFAAVGTVSAFFLGLGILANDRVKATRKHADEFATWPEWEKREGGPDANVLSVRAYNAGTAPVPKADVICLLEIDGKPVVRTFFHLQTKTQHSYSPVLASGMTAYGSINLVPNSRNLQICVMFIDASNSVWVRDLASGKYLSSKRRKKFGLDQGFNSSLYPGVPRNGS